MNKLAKYSLPFIFAVALTSAGLAQTGKADDSSRDARQNGPTADNQKNNAADRKTTADIRRAVVGDKSLSTTAHNVKIITRNGDVTVRGHVKSEEERHTIVAKAEEIAGKGRVTDQLQVTAGASSREKHPDQQ